MWRNTLETVAAGCERSAARKNCYSATEDPPGVDSGPGRAPRSSGRSNCRMTIRCQTSPEPTQPFPIDARSGVVHVPSESCTGQELQPVELAAGTARAPAITAGAAEGNGDDYAADAGQPKRTGARTGSDIGTAPLRVRVPVAVAVGPDGRSAPTSRTDELWRADGQDSPRRIGA